MLVNKVILDYHDCLYKYNALNVLQKCLENRDLEDKNYTYI